MQIAPTTGLPTSPCFLIMTSQQPVLSETKGPDISVMFQQSGNNFEIFAKTFLLCNSEKIEITLDSKIFIQSF